MIWGKKSGVTFWRPRHNRRSSFFALYILAENKGLDQILLYEVDNYVIGHTTV